MTAYSPRVVAMLIAQLTFRGMPLVQGITLAQLIRLHELQASEINSLLNAAMDLPIPSLPDKPICLGKHTFFSVGEMAGHLIAFGLSQKLGVEKIGMLICIAGWILNAELGPQQTVRIMNDAIQSAVLNASSIHS